MTDALISPAMAAKAKRYARRGFATALAIADPVRILDIRRRDPGTGTWSVVIAGGEFRVKRDNAQENRGGDEAAESVQMSGTMRRLIPTSGPRLQPGDRTLLPEVGPITITAIAPDRFGTETATWILEEGSS